MGDTDRQTQTDRHRQTDTDRQTQTDNNPLTYIHKSLKVDATSQRWLAALGEYDFSIHYKPGTTNVDADILSRLHETSDVSVEHISAVTEETEEFAKYVNITDLDEEMLAHVNSLKTPFDWRALQLEDPDLSLAHDLISLKQNMHLKTY